MSGTDDAHSLIGSVQRAIRLLDLVAASPRPVTVKALAVASRMSLGTTYNLVRTLVHEGYLGRDPDGLLLGDRLPSPGPGAQRGAMLPRYRRATRAVSEQLRLNAYLARYVDGEVEIVDIVESLHVPRIELSVSTLEHAHATAIGKRILSGLSTQERDDYLARHPLASLTRNTLTQRDALEEELAAGSPMTLDRQEFSVGLNCVAVPVEGGGFRGALGVGLSADLPGPPLDSIVEALEGAARSLSLELGAIAQLGGTA
ncbi:MAG: helix-turn-helix domain-containing protein [Microbacteriaceae bacterium]|nr:helix-turn-helix domain-containing protein [Microbacteriaceae bacterium]